jgi:hypothetical protein
MDNYPENNPENIPKPERYRGLSIAALVMGLLGAAAIPQIFRWSSDFRVFRFKYPGSQAYYCFYTWNRPAPVWDYLREHRFKEDKVRFIQQEGEGFFHNSNSIGCSFSYTRLILVCWGGIV